MKYIIKMDVYIDKDVILDKTYITDYVTIPVNFSWYKARPKYIASLQLSRHVIR